MPARGAYIIIRGASAPVVLVLSGTPVPAPGPASTVRSVLPGTPVPARGAYIIIRGASATVVLVLPGTPVPATGASATVVPAPGASATAVLALSGTLVPALGASSTVVMVLSGTLVPAPGAPHLHVSHGPGVWVKKCRQGPRPSVTACGVTDRERHREAQTGRQTPAQVMIFPSTEVLGSQTATDTQRQAQAERHQSKGTFSLRLEPLRHRQTDTQWHTQAGRDQAKGMIFP